MCFLCEQTDEIAYPGSPWSGVCINIHTDTKPIISYNIIFPTMQFEIDVYIFRIQSGTNVLIWYYIQY